MKLKLKETTFNGETTLERHVVAIDAVNVEEEMTGLVRCVGERERECGVGSGSGRGSVGR